MTDGVSSITLQSLLAMRHSPPAHTTLFAGTEQAPGIVPGKERGDGLEFQDLRHYVPGDDIRHIDWNVTARTGDPWTRVFRRENDQSLLVAVDFRRCMFTGSQRLQAVAAALLAADLLWQAAHRGDRCSVLIITDQSIVASKPQRGHRGPLDACHVLYEQYVQAARTSGPQSGVGASPPLVTLLPRLTSLDPHYSHALLITSLDNTGGDAWQKAAATLGASGKLSLAMLQDPLLTQPLPPGHYSVARTSHGQASLVSLTAQQAQAVHARISAMQQSRLAELRALGWVVTSLPTDADASTLTQGLIAAGLGRQRS